MQEHAVDPLELVARDLQAALTDVGNRRHNLSDGLAKSVLEALKAWSIMAQSPGHQAQGAARELLVRWVKVLDAGRAIASGIQVVPTLPGAGNGRS